MRALRCSAVVLVAALVGVHSPDAEAGLKVSFTTSPAGGVYAPSHVVAVWIETGAGAFVKTVGRWSATRTSSLTTWIAKAGQGDVDAVSGATQNLQPNNLATLEWDLKDRQGQIVPDGTYTIKLELADFNPGQGTPNLGTFTFVKSDQPQVQTGQTNGGFSNVTIDFAPAPPATCGNGVADPGETCDPMIASGTGACVASCEATGDACAPNVIVGSATSCSAECQITEITACASGDGCCPDGCDGTDDDCAGGGGNGTGPELTGGCSTSDDSGAALAAFGLGFVALARRRRRR